MRIVYRRHREPSTFPGGFERNCPYPEQPLQERLLDMNILNAGQIDRARGSGEEAGLVLKFSAAYSDRSKSPMDVPGNRNQQDDRGHNVQSVNAALIAIIVVKEHQCVKRESQSKNGPDETTAGVDPDRGGGTAGFHLAQSAIVLQLPVSLS